MGGNIVKRAGSYPLIMFDKSPYMQRVDPLVFTQFCEDDDE